METIQLTLWNPQQAYQEIKRAWEWSKAMLMAGHKLVMTIKTESKTREQEEKYHAMIGDISKQASHQGSHWSQDDWKRLLLDKFARDTGRSHGKVVINLDQTGIVEVGIQSRKFTISDANEFIEWLYAWGTEHGIEFKDSLQQGR